MTPLCAVCISNYDLRAYPVVGQCGHSICLLCSLQLPNAKCPICRSVGSFVRSSKNYRAYEIIQKVFVKTVEDECLLRRLQTTQAIIRLKKHSITELKRQLEPEENQLGESDLDSIPDEDFDRVDEILRQFEWERLE